MIDPVIPTLEEDEKLGRAIITCLCRKDVLNLIRKGYLLDEDAMHAEDLSPSEKIAFESLKALKGILSREEHLQIPFLLFMHSEEPSVVSSADYNSLSTFLCLCDANRLWRICCAEFNSLDMAGVYTSLEWLYAGLHKKSVELDITER